MHTHYERFTCRWSCILLSYIGNQLTPPNGWMSKGASCTWSLTSAVQTGNCTSAWLWFIQIFSKSCSHGSRSWIHSCLNLHNVVYNRLHNTSPIFLVIQVLLLQAVFRKLLYWTWRMECFLFWGGPPIISNHVKCLCWLIVRVLRRRIYEGSA